MARTNGMPVGTDVRERLRAAQRAETDAIANVEKALAAEAKVRARLDDFARTLQSELSKATRLVRAAQAVVVRTSGIERAAALLDVSPKALRTAIHETSTGAGVQD